MARYVNIDNLEYTSYILDGGFSETTFITKEDLEKMCEVSVKPVIYGSWRLETDEECPNPMFKLVICSNCKESSNSTYRFCPNCGADMGSLKSAEIRRMPKELLESLKHIKPQLETKVCGRWIKASCSEHDGDAHCSECGHWDWSDCNYCSKCGAKIEAEK